MLQGAAGAAGGAAGGDFGALVTSKADLGTEGLLKNAATRSIFSALHSSTSTVCMSHCAWMLLRCLLKTAAEAFQALLLHAIAELSTMPFPPSYLDLQSCFVDQYMKQHEDLRE